MLVHAALYLLDWVPTSRKRSHNTKLSPFITRLSHCGLKMSHTNETTVRNTTENTLTDECKQLYSIYMLYVSETIEVVAVDMEGR